MNNGMNSNNSNNGLNGEVLGSVGSTTNLNNPPTELETLETLDANMAIPNSTMNNSSNVVLDNNLNSNSSMVGNLEGQTVMQSNPNNETTSQVVEQPAVNNQMPVTPEPAYTNPQSINPMPGFENSATIGTTPPISLEPEKKPQKKKQNKTLFVVIIIVVLFGIGFGTFYVLKYTDLLNNAPKIVITTNTLEVNMGDTLSSNISDFAQVTGTDIKNCSLNVLDVNTEVAGTYEYQVTCGEIIKKGTVNVVDNTELVVNVQKVYKTKDETIEAKEFIVNPNETYTYEFVDEAAVLEKLNGEAGTYQIKIKAISGTKNLEVDAELVILQYKIKGYLVCSSKEQSLTSDSATMTVQEKFALVEDGKSGFGGISTETYKFKFSDETKYADYLAKYNTEGSLTINNVTGTSSFDDANLTITITNDRTSEDVISEYGEANMEKYSTIKSHFETKLGYTCEYIVE